MVAAAGEAPVVEVVAVAAAELTPTSDAMATLSASYGVAPSVLAPYLAALRVGQQHKARGEAVAIAADFIDHA